MWFVLESTVFAHFRAARLIPNPAKLTTERTEDTEDDLFMIRCGRKKIVRYQWHRGGVHRLLLNKRASGFDDLEFHKRSGVEIDFGHAGKVSRDRRRWSPTRGIRPNGPHLLHGLLPSNPAFCPILTEWLVESRPLGCRRMSTARFLRRPEACGFFPADEPSPWR